MLNLLETFVWLLLQVILPNLANRASPNILEYASGIVMILTLGSIIIRFTNMDGRKVKPLQYIERR